MNGLRVHAEKKLAMHRKAYEFTQTAWGLGRLGMLTEDAAVLSVGAGHESLVLACESGPAGRRDRSVSR